MSRKGKLQEDNDVCRNEGKAITLGLHISPRLIIQSAG